MARYRLRLLLQEFDLPPGEISLGRSPECRVTIDDPLVSREHAKVIVTGDRVVLRDLGSRNGSKVNGRPVSGEVELHDGDRVRIGNQELVFSRVIAPLPAGRPTANLRYCAKCQMPMAEAPSCPNCGHSPGSQDTLRAVNPTLDRADWSLQLHLELLDRALALGRLADGDRAMRRIADAVDERVKAGVEVDDAQLEPAFAGAVRLSAALGEGGWIRWILTTLERLERHPKPVLVALVGRLPPIVLDGVGDALEHAVDFWERRRDQLDSGSITALNHLVAMRDERSARRGRSLSGLRGS